MSETPVTITFSMEEARDIQSGLADVLCWVRGFCAATPVGENNPIGQDELRRLNIKLQGAMRAAKEREAAL